MAFSMEIQARIPEDRPGCGSGNDDSGHCV